jgi:hypothetical protein
VKSAPKKIPAKRTPPRRLSFTIASEIITNEKSKSDGNENEMDAETNNKMYQFQKF